MSEKTVSYSRTETVCDKCGCSERQQDSDGNANFTPCRICKRDFCYECYKEHNNSIEVLQDMFRWDEGAGFLCDECYEKMKIKSTLQDGIARYIQAKTDKRTAELNLSAAARIIMSSI